MSRYRFTPVVAVGAPFGLLVMIGLTGGVVGALVLQAFRPETSRGESIFLGVVAVAMLAVGGFAIAVVLGWIRAAAKGWVAPQIDRDGVTLGRRPFPGSRAVAVPWRDIEEIVLFYYKGPRSGASVPCVGLRLVPTAPRQSGGPPAAP